LARARLKLASRRDAETTTYSAGGSTPHGKSDQGEAPDEIVSRFLAPGRAFYWLLVRLHIAGER
jgi:hypothetical protein